jgi:hydroxymethylpyrimidine pyrophosphatase-like HAD family hydrolase
VDREEWTVGFAPTVVPSYAELPERVVKIVGVARGDQIAAASAADVLRQLGGDVSAALPQPYYLDVTHPAANKGEAVDALASLVGIPSAEIVSVGDMPNDVLMFRRSGVSVAMGNASAEVQAAATFVTAPDVEDGFALAMERFVLHDARTD